MVNTYFLELKQKIKDKKRFLIVGFCAGFIGWSVLYPQDFIDLWLTENQQGKVYFQLKNYEKAANTFSNIEWQAYSRYGAEQYKQAINLYGQSTDIESQFARANTYAHNREYVNARRIYQEILKQEPNHKGANNNLSIITKIIDEINLMSESQQQEDSIASRELGDAPQTADGAEREVEREVDESLTAEKLLLDSRLSDMWLRQVQKNPSRFLSQKFYMQLEQQNGESNND